MHKYIEKLTERYLDPKACEIARKVFERDFDKTFKECCEKPDPKNTTIGQCADKLTETAFKEVWEFFGNELGEVNFFSTMSKKNVFLPFMVALIQEVEEQIDIQGTIEQCINDEISEKERLLRESRKLDDNGDYTGI